MTFAIPRLQRAAATPPVSDAPPPTSSVTPNRIGVVPAKVDFNRDVIPVLSNNCFKCHGPDPDNRKAGLRLDIREVAIKPAESGSIAIVPGKPDDSELVHRIFSDDPDERMPSKESNKSLTETQKQILRRWIAEGAEYKPHWSFVAPRQAPLPSVKRTNWAKNPLDDFVLAKLAAEGLSPSPEADRYTLVRRLYLDLIGLPPTPGEADAFAHDSAPDAYKQLVDKLLSSPHYGERWARRWLDLARYADTNGYEKDRPRSIWPYRDWVINALNADMPFDRFTVEQLAGDMLPGATAEQKIATGFHRNTMRNEEGGIDPLEFRYYSLVDRVSTTGTTWLGLTVACAQCHTHKFDPITNCEYYQLMAFLDNADEPEMPLPDERIAAKRAEIESRIAELTAELPDHFPVAQGHSRDVTKASVTGTSGGKVKSDSSPAPNKTVATVADHREAFDRAFAEWAKGASKKAIHWQVLRPTEMHSSTPTLNLLKDDSVLASGDLTKSDTYDLTFHPALHGVTAVRLEALPHDSLPKHGPGMIYYEGPAGDFFLSEIQCVANGHAQKFASAVQSYSAAGFEASHAIDGDPQTGWMITGGQGKPHYAVFRLAQPADTTGEFKIHMLFERYYAAALGRFRISVSTDPHAGESAPFPPEIDAALATPAEHRTAEQVAALRSYYASIAPELSEPRKEIERLRGEIPEPPSTLVMSERPADHARVTRVHHRGEFLQAKDPVEPGVPAFLPALPAGAPRNRLALARWLVSPDNPLTARVTVNRQWAAIFGRGIVRTLGDFGYQGEPPTDQALLDWLAVELVKEKWSLKKITRLIVTSATYRQSSRVAPELLARDPENVLLARGSRFRLDAEVLRDTALKSAGLLSEKLGGPSVFPPQPASVTTEGAYGSLAWNTSTGEDRYRRSLYTYAKRTAPFAMYNAFDAPSGESCVARREVSNSPLQALTLLNDTVLMEAAQSLGKLAANASGTDESRATMLFRRCLTRPPEAEELTQLVAFAAKERKRFAANEAEAAKLAGDAKQPVERATWTAVARALLNLDEAITRN